METKTIEASIHPQVYLQINDHHHRTSVTGCADGSLLLLYGTRDANNKITVSQTVDILMNAHDTSTIDTGYFFSKIRLLASNSSEAQQVLGLVMFRDIDGIPNKNKPNNTLSEKQTRIISEVRQHVDSDTMCVLFYNAANCSSSLYSCSTSNEFSAIPVVNVSGPTEFASISSILNPGISQSDKKNGTGPLFSMDEFSQELSQKRRSLQTLSDEKLRTIDQFLADVGTAEDLSNSDFAKLQKLGNIVELLTNTGFTPKNDDTCLNAFLGLMQTNLVGNGQEGSVLSLLDINKKLLRKL